MKLPETAHFSRPWRIHQITPDFRLEDVWALNTPGERDDFARLVQMVAAFDTKQRRSVVGLLFAIRELLGRALGWDSPDASDDRQTLRGRLPADLRDAASSVNPAPFTALYQTDDEWAAEIINKTVHGVIHLGWVPDGAGRYRGQLAILVKPNGLLGGAYMAAITPFRYLIVYPRMLNGFARKWRSHSENQA
jgi:hypothetical protein